MATKEMDEVEILIKRAADTPQAHEAMQLAQAALNAAHARQVVKQTERQ